MKAFLGVIVLVLLVSLGDRSVTSNSNQIFAGQPRLGPSRLAPTVAASGTLAEKASCHSAVTPRRNQLVGFKAKKTNKQETEVGTAAEASKEVKGRQPVPDEAALVSATETIHETFKDEYELATTPAQLIELANILLKQARETKNDSASQYALLQEAGKKANSAGELQLALQVCDEMARSFIVDAVVLKSTTLQTAKRLAKSSQQRSVLLEQSTKLMEDAIAADNFKESRTIGELALSIAKAIKDATAVKRLDSRLKRRTKSPPNTSRSKAID